jgi:hypothetical protein
VHVADWPRHILLQRNLIKTTAMRSHTLLYRGPFYFMGKNYEVDFNKITITLDSLPPAN